MHEAPVLRTLDVPVPQAQPLGACRRRPGFHKTCAADRAAEKRRARHHLAGTILVIIRSNPFKLWEPQHNRSEVVSLAAPSVDTRDLIRAALTRLRRIYQSGYAYEKAGVMLCGLEQQQRSQGTSGGRS